MQELATLMCHKSDEGGIGAIWDTVGHGMFDAQLRKAVMHGLRHISKHWAVVQDNNLGLPARRGLFETWGCSRGSMGSSESKIWCSADECWKIAMFM